MCASRSALADAGSFSWTRARGADNCPSRASVGRELNTALGRPVEEALEGRSLDAVIERSESEWVVTLYWRAGDGTPAGTRVIRESSTGCDAPTRSAMTSVLVALGADGIDAHESSPAPGSSSSPPPSAASSSPPPVDNAASSGTPSEAPPAAAAPSADTVRAGDIALSGILSVGWLPAPAYGVQLIAEPLVWRRLRISVLASTLAEVRVTLGSVQAGFTALEFGVDACGTLVRVASWVDLIACGGLRGGVVNSVVYQGTQGLGGAQAAFAAEATGLIRLTPVAPAVLEVGFIGRANLTQYELAGTPGGASVYSQSIGAFITTIRLGVHF